MIELLYFMCGMLVTLWLHPLSSHYVRWRSRRSIDGCTVWIETHDNRGRPYGPGFTMYRCLHPKEPGAKHEPFPFPSMVPAAVERYIIEHAR